MWWKPIDRDVYEGWSRRIYLRDATVEVKLIWDESMKVCSFMDMLLSSCSKRNKDRLVRKMLSHGIYPMRSACVCSDMHEFNVVWVNERERERKDLCRGWSADIELENCWKSVEQCLVKRSLLIRITPPTLARWSELPQIHLTRIFNRWTRC